MPPARVICVKINTREFFNITQIMGYFILTLIGIILGSIGGMLKFELLMIIGVVFCLPAALRLGWWFFKNT